MSMAELSSLIPEHCNKNTKVRIVLGKVWEESGSDYKDHKYWKKFFDKYKPGSVATIGELLMYEGFATPEWIPMYKYEDKLVWRETDKKVFVGCTFGLLDVGKNGQHNLIRPDYVYLEVL